MVCLGRSGRNRTCDPLIPNQVPFRLATLRFIFSGGVIGTRTQKGVTPDRLAICSNTNYGITPLLAEDRRIERPSITSPTGSNRVANHLAVSSINYIYYK